MLFCNTNFIKSFTIRKQGTKEIDSEKIERLQKDNVNFRNAINHVKKLIRKKPALEWFAEQDSSKLNVFWDPQKARKQSQFKSIEI